MRNRGTTLIELVLVIVIVGVLAALAIPRMSIASERARYTSTWATYRNLAAGIESYRSVWKALPPDSSAAASPVGMSSFVDPRVWQRRTPLGGAWDWNSGLHANGSTVAIWTSLPPNISINRLTDPQVLARTAILDRLFDDNNINTGQLRRLRPEQHCYILDE